MIPPLEPVREYLEMCDATRRTLRPQDITSHDEWVTTFRATLEDVYQLDLTDPRIIAAVSAGVVEGLGAAMEHDSPVRGSLACGWALFDLAKPHLIEAVAS